MENIRRKHNYIPFIVQLFTVRHLRKLLLLPCSHLPLGPSLRCRVGVWTQELAKKKALLPLLDAAKARAETLRAARLERKKQAKATGAMDDDSDSD